MTRFLPVITPDYRITTDLLSLSFEERAGKAFTLKEKAGEVVILYPSSFLFNHPKAAPWLEKVVTETLRRQAKALLVPRLLCHAEKTGLHPEHIFIKRQRSCWGSCSGRKNINLSLYLMLLPSSLVDYVLLHELCHLQEMNHSPRFWALLDTFLSGEAKQRRAELRRYQREHLSFPPQPNTRP